MVFNSLTFVVFFGVVLGLNWAPISWSARKVILLVASYLFYGAWNPPFVLLLLFSTAVDWFVAKWMADAQGSRRKALLLVSLAANLGLLGYFKYAEFAVVTFSELVAALGVVYVPPELDIYLPVGISFYTFQTLSYTIDVYRGDCRPWRRMLDFALYVSFFPQLVAGPIVRASEFREQVEGPPQRGDKDQIGWGFFLIVFGLFQKVFLADYLLAVHADSVFGSGSEVGFGDAWLGTLAFSGQIFCDFAGYSTCAIGAALCLGFRFSGNFNSPYAAIGLSDFWARWHISLSSWLRDYLYISLGGNRSGAIRRYRNLMLTMLLGGLWHGASWKFVVWGGLHGTYLVAEHAIRQRWPGLFRAGHSRSGIPLAVVTYLLVCLTWVFFRAGTIRDAINMTCSMVGLNGLTPPGLISPPHAALILTVTVLMLAFQWCLRDQQLEDVFSRVPWYGRSLVMAAFLVAVSLVTGETRAFIYFQF